MATLKSIATGLASAGGTWGLVDATSFNSSTETATALTTSYQASSGSTTGVITVDGVAVKLAVRTGTTGTMSVHLAIATVEVPGTLVTINTADLPVAATADLNGGWHYFKFATPVALVGATSYTVEAKTSSSSQVSLFATSGTNWSRALVTTTTQAPAAGDDMIIAGEYTGAGTSNSFTVTWDITATTDFGSTPTAANSLLAPGMCVCNKGTVTWGTTAATNYNMKMSNSIIIYSGGTLNMGTVATACPRDSSMKLNFDCGANVDYGLIVRNLGTFNAQGLSRTSGKLIYYCKLNTDEAIASTSLGVDTDTGWLDNDQIAVASTTRTVGDSELGAMNGNAGASSLTVDGFAGAGGGLAVAHSGTSPTQAEVILLTRNVSIFGASATLQAYIDIKATATVDCDWAEFYWLGSATANKRGIDIATTTGSVSFQYCSRHTSTVVSSLGFSLGGSTGSGITISNNVTWNIANYHFGFALSTTGVPVIDSNIFIKNSDLVQIVFLADIGCTFTNNTLVSSSAGGTGAMIYNEANTAIGTHTGNVVHSNGGIGVYMGSSVVGGTLQDYTVWRNGSYGLGLWNVSITGPYGATFKNFTMFGNTTASVIIGFSGMESIIFDNLVSNGDTTFSTTTGVDQTSAGGKPLITFINCDFSTVSGIKTAHTRDFSCGATPTMFAFKVINCKIGSATPVAFQASLATESFIAFQKYNQTSNSHRVYKKYGTIFIDTGTVRTGSQSMKMTPNNASNKLQSYGPYGGFKVQVASGQTCTPYVYVYEDASYNGARARLIVLRNYALGITADTVLDTATAASDAAWEQLTGTTAAVTDAGTLEFIIDCDGTAGNLFVDDFSATVA